MHIYIYKSIFLLAATLSSRHSAFQYKKSFTLSGRSHISALGFSTDRSFNTNMGLFRKSSNASTGAGHLHAPDTKLTKEDREHFKLRASSVHDPVLEAVQEAQPFEQAADVSQDDPNRKSYYSGDGPDHLTRDVFGQPIQQPDISNPMRARDERPLDTIRGFEYSISGDPSWGQRLETHQYGFRVRPDFPQFGNSGDAMAASGPGGMPSSQFMMQEQAIYSAPAPGSALNPSKKKKKRGLFGRKKDTAE